MSLLADTNVVSELIRRSPDPAVAGWGAARPLRGLFVFAAGEAELRSGGAILAADRCRDTLTADIERMPEGDRSVVSGMSGATEAFARVKIDALLKDAGRNLTDGSSVPFVFLSSGSATFGK